MTSRDADSVKRLKDAELARRIPGAGGEAAAAEEGELCRRYARRVFAYGLRHLRAEDRALDLVQEVFLVTLEKLRAGEVRDPEKIGSFILGVARMVSRSLGRTGSREVTLEAVRESRLMVEPPASDPIVRGRVAGCLEELQERQLTVVILTYFAEQSTGAIASSLGLSTGNVRVLRHRGITQLRSCLGFDDREAA